MKRLIKVGVKKMKKQSLKVMSVFGTRPEAIKMAPVVQELASRVDDITSVVVVTAQHREMLDQVLDTFSIVPDYDLDVMTANQSLSQITSRILTALDDILLTEKPDVVLVHGDTTTSFVASLAAFYHQIPIGHVEAGLRTWNKYSPFPEEANRQMTDVLSDIYFAPTTLSRDNLLKEGVAPEHIHVTGNTVVDAIHQTIQTSFNHNIMEQLMPNSTRILLTMHRRENIGEPMKQVFKAVRQIVEERPEVEVIYPVHPNPNVRALATDYLGDLDRVHLIEPLNVLEFHHCMNLSHFIMSDSGGIQEEAPSVNKPVLVLRDTTERPEGLETGILTLVGTDETKVYKAAMELLNQPDYYESLTKQANPYGDGSARIKIVDEILRKYQENNGKKKKDF